MSYYPSLSSPEPIKRPFRCSPGVEVIIDDIHPYDPKHTIKDTLIGKRAIVGTRQPCYRRRESYSTERVRRCYADCALEIDGIIKNFVAVRFHRIFPAQSTFYKYNPKRA